MSAFLRKVASEISTLLQGFPFTSFILVFETFIAPTTNGKFIVSEKSSRLNLKLLSVFERTFSDSTMTLFA